MATAKKTASAGKKSTILCIDDDPDFLEAVEMILESGGYAVVRAASAEEGLERAKEAKPDLILVDLMMEEVDAGLTFARKMKATDPRTPIILTSAVGDGLSGTALPPDLKLDGVLQKPLDPKVLLALVKAKIR